MESGELRQRRGFLLAWVGLLLVAALTVLANAAQAAPPSTPWTWGANTYGELGTGGTAPRTTPAPVDLESVVDAHGGREHVVALRADGTVWTWGSNQHGQLGTGGSSNRSTPAQVPGLSGVVAVETGHNHSMALTSDGRIWAWGYNADGQLGDGTTTLRRTPVRVAGVVDAVAIAGGRDMAYAVRADGTVLGWGRNTEGQVGDGTTTRRTSPVAVSGLDQVVRIAGGRDHGLAVRTDGSVWSWGSNDYGQLGLGNSGAATDRLVPVQVIASGMSDVTAGAHHSYALAADGTVRSWGRNYRANLGDGTTSTRTRPVTVREVSGAVSIASGRDHGLAVLADGRVRAWGENSSGQLGDGSTTDRSTPVLVPGVTDAVQAGGGGGAYSVVLVGSGTPPANQPPVARIEVSCQGSTCTYSGATSSDPDGQVVAWSWELPGGEQASGEEVTQTDVAPGEHVVRLSVADDDGATDAVTATVTVQPPGPGSVTHVGEATQNANTQTPTVTAPAGVEAGDRMVLSVSINRAGSLTVPAGWSLLGTVSDGTEVRSWVLTRVAAAGTAGSQVRVSLDAYAKSATHLSVHRGAGEPAVTGRAETVTTAVHSAPAASAATAGSTVLRTWVDKLSTAHDWTVPASLTPRAATRGSGGGLLTSVLADQTGVAAGPVPAVAADAGLASGKAIAWTVVLPPS